MKFIYPEGMEESAEIHLPRIAFESTVITHGLPRPENLELARDMERAAERYDVIPSTIAVLDGEIHVGLTGEEMEQLANEPNVCKISRRDLARAVHKKETGGTTVAGTMFVAHQAGIRVFATGGIGGVHDVETLDISTDLPALADTPMIVVCAGAKAILNLPATMEYLETMAVPVVGYQTDEFPAFYSRRSGMGVTVRLDSPEDVVEFARTHWGLGMKTAVLVCQPLSIDEEVPREEIGPAIERVRQEAREQRVHGQSLTPFLLNRLAEITGGASLQANLALLVNNAHLGAQIALAISKQ